MDGKKDKTNSFISDDLIPNILSRLPIKSVVRCRLVCKRWRDITLDSDFLDLPSRNSNIPTILVANPREYSRLDLFALDNWSRFDLFALDNWWEPAQTSFTPYRFPFFAGKLSNTSSALFSHAGLVVFRQNPFSDVSFTILNPISRENVRINLSYNFRRSQIFGVYFHPSLKQYCSLWRMIDASGSVLDRSNQYKMLNLGSNPSFKNLSNPFSNRDIKRSSGNSLFINNSLYWMLESEHGHRYGGRNDIIEFDIMNEEFIVMPCPVSHDTECKYCQTHLLNSDGILSFLLILPSKIIIWRLKDHAEKFWLATEYTFSVEVSSSFEFNWVEPGAIAVVDGKLALSSMRELFVCELMEGTVKNGQKRKYNRDTMFLSHQMSLASLRDCKPTMFIDEDGQVV